jgi:hypothetical protein
MPHYSLPQRVSDSRANRNELIELAVSTIGRSKARRAVFEAIYYHKSRIKSADQIVIMTGLPRIRVLQEANRLATQEIVGKVQQQGELIAYQQDKFYQANKLEILRQLDDNSRRAAFPTKRTPKSKVDVAVRSSRRVEDAKFITVDDVESFVKVRGVKPNPKLIAPPEGVFKLGLQKIIGEEGTFTDWGGEQNDLFSTWVRIGGKRKRAAFALKGPGKKGKMTLRHLGKNADQIPRLFKSPADIFFVQHHDEIDQMVIEEMEVHARNLARRRGQTVWYGVIDGQDSRRLIRAYPRAFLNGTSKRRYSSR